MHNFHPLDVVGRGSETQLQMGEIFNKKLEIIKGYYYQNMTGSQSYPPNKTFIQRRPNVLDVCLTLYKCYTNVSFAGHQLPLTATSII